MTSKAEVSLRLIGCDHCSVPLHRASYSPKRSGGGVSREEMTTGLQRGDRRPDTASALSRESTKKQKNGIFSCMPPCLHQGGSFFVESFSVKCLNKRTNCVAWSHVYLKQDLGQKKARLAQLVTCLPAGMERSDLSRTGRRTIVK
jgi:hypothetical protein